MRGRKTVGLVLLLGTAATRADDAATAAAPATRAGPAAPASSVPAGGAEWSEALNGLRVRLTAPNGSTHRGTSPLPLRVEVQNHSDRPVAYRTLWTTVRMLAHDGDGKWLGVPWMGPEVGEWAAKPGDLGPGQVIALTLAFQNLRFNRPLRAGESIELRAGAPTRQRVPGQLPPEVNSPPLTVRVAAAFPQPLVEADVAADWQADLACRVDAGLLGSQTVRVDAKGTATLVQHTQRNGVRVEGRWAVPLPPDRLARLAADLRAAEVWRLDEAGSGPPVPDGGSIRLALVGRSGGSVVGEFATRVTDEPPVVRAVRAMVEELILDVEARATTRPARPE